MSETKPKQDWLTIKDVEEEFQISRQLQQRWRSRGIIPFSKIAKTIRYNRTRIEAFFNNEDKTK